MVAAVLGLVLLAGAMPGAGAAADTGALAPPTGLPLIAGAAEKAIGITDLGTLGGAYSFALDVNEQGQVVGRSDRADGSTHAFVWDRGVMTDLGTLGGTTSQAVAINDAGLVAGSSTTADGTDHAFAWWRGVMTDLGPGSGVTVNERGEVLIAVDSRAFLWRAGARRQIGTAGPPDDAYQWLNDHGQAAGSSGSPSIWRDGRLRSLGLPPGSASAGVVGINNRADVIANAVTEDGLTHGFRWTGGHGTGGRWTAVADPGRASTANAVNDRGSIAGNYLQPGELPDRAFLRRGGTVTILASLPAGCQATGVLDLNERDDAVGYCTAGDNGRYIGTLWRNGRVQALPGLGAPGPDIDPIGDLRSTYVSDINDRGQIAGTAYLDSGAPHAVLLQAN